MVTLTALALLTAGSKVERRSGVGARLKQMLRRYSIDVKLYIYIGSFFC